MTKSVDLIPPACVYDILLNHCHYAGRSAKPGRYGYRITHARWPVWRPKMSRRRPACVNRIILFSNVDLEHCIMCHLDSPI